MRLELEFRCAGAARRWNVNLRQWNKRRAEGLRLVRYTENAADSEDVGMGRRWRGRGLYLSNIRHRRCCFQHLGRAQFHAVSMATIRCWKPPWHSLKTPKKQKWLSPAAGGNSEMWSVQTGSPKCGLTIRSHLRSLFAGCLRLRSQCGH